MRIAATDTVFEFLLKITQVVNGQLEAAIVSENR